MGFKNSLAMLCYLGAHSWQERCLRSSTLILIIIGYQNKNKTVPRILGKLILSMLITSDHEDEFAVEEKKSRPRQTG